MGIVIIFGVLLLFHFSACVWGNMIESEENPVIVKDQLDSNGMVRQVTMATTMVTGTDWLGNPVTTPSSFVLEPSQKEFETCIFGCSSVTVPCSTQTDSSTVIVVLPLTIPCSLVKCPPCTTCVPSTVSITLCPIITTITPTPATATIFTTAASIATEKCKAMISQAVRAVEDKVASLTSGVVTSIVTVTRTRVPLGCPAGFGQEPVTSTMTGPSVCSTFVVCQAKRFTCPLPLLPSSVSEELLIGTHPIDTVQALLATSLTSADASEAASSIESSVLEASSSHEETTTIQPQPTGMIAERMYQSNDGYSQRPNMAFIVLAMIVILSLTVLIG